VVDIGEIISLNPLKATWTMRKDTKDEGIGLPKQISLSVRVNARPFIISVSIRADPGISYHGFVLLD
jgi:hypothetical protein